MWDKVVGVFIGDTWHRSYFAFVHDFVSKSWICTLDICYVFCWRPIGGLGLFSFGFPLKALISPLNNKPGGWP